MKPNLIQIYNHACPGAPWWCATPWITAEYFNFCSENHREIGIPDFTDCAFVNWFLEKYWPDWEENYNG